MNRLRKLKHLFLNYVVRDRRKPAQNRQHVGQNLMVLSIFIFFVFIINFVVIIGTDSKFGVDLSTQAAKSYNHSGCQAWDDLRPKWKCFG